MKCVIKYHLTAGKPLFQVDLDGNANHFPPTFLRTGMITGCHGTHPNTKELTSSEFPPDKSGYLTLCYTISTLSTWDGWKIIQTILCACNALSHILRYDNPLLVSRVGNLPLKFDQCYDKTIIIDIDVSRKV